MTLNQLEGHKALEKSLAKAHLIRLLQNAHAGERAAANAYWGHAYSLFTTDPIERAEILKIYEDELHHRKALKKMLTDLGAAPRLLREIGMFLVGATIALLCQFGGWFIPMYGAGKLESTNIEEYEVAARLALLAGHEELIDELISFAQVEFDHEVYFRNKASCHRLAKIFGLWPATRQREIIQSDFDTFKARKII